MAPQTFQVTLCLLLKDNQILLAKKKRGFGKGKFNGVGGKLEPGETADEAMLRETKEEIGVLPTAYKQVGTIDFDEYFGDERMFVKMFIYTATDWEGELIESDEMAPQWFNLSEIPYDQLLPDDKYWLPLVLDGKNIKAYFKFNQNWDLLHKDITVL